MIMVVAWKGSVGYRNGRGYGMGIGGVLVTVVVAGRGKGCWGYRGERRCKTAQGKGWEAREGVGDVKT